MNILAISGSIRPDSSNAALLKTTRAMVPSAAWTDFEIKELPYFDPTLQFGEKTPAIVLHLRQLVKEADFLFIATPEYAHGIPGILKNALEWLVCEETMRKKVITLIGSPSGGEYVKTFLLETLQTMDMITNEEMTFVTKLARTDLSEVEFPLQEFLLRNGFLAVRS